MLYVYFVLQVFLVLQVRKESPVSLVTQVCPDQMDALDFLDHQVWVQARTNTHSDGIHRKEPRVLT